MQGLEITGSLDRDWRASIERHFEMNLTPFSADLRRVRISFDRAPANAYVCNLRAERLSGDELAVTVEHDDGEFAIGFACARARREMQRESRLGRRQSR